MKKRPRLAPVVLLAVVWAASSASSADRYVSMGGRDTANDCLTAASPCATVSYATSQASSGDTINVASGSYRDNIRMQDSATLAFLGGWDATFTSRNPRTAPSIVKAGQVHLPSFRGRERVWGIFAWNGIVIDVTIDGFVLLGGRAATPVVPDNLIGNLAAQGHAGGGLAAVAASDSRITLRMSNTIVTKNKDAYGGAGLSLWVLDNSALDVTLDTVQITRNKSSGAGGGILAFDAPYLGQEPSHLTFRLTNGIVANNTTVSSGGGLLTSNFGPQGSTLAATVVSTTITRNTAKTGGPCRTTCIRLGGGGIYTNGPLHLALTDTILYGNLLTGVGTGRDFFNEGGGSLALDADHDDIGDIVLQGGTFNDLGGNLSADPVLDRGYELGAGSPVIDVGTCTGAPSTDFEGDPRPSGAGCDIGADEFQF
jgi:hypothetical protein